MGPLFTSNFDMRRFLVKVIAFFIGLSGLLFGACFLLPNPDARKTMLGAQIDKINWVAD